MSLRPLKRCRLLAASAIGTTSLSSASARVWPARRHRPRLASPVTTPIVGAGDLPLEHIALLTGSDPLSINDTDTEYGIHGTDLRSSFLYNNQLYIVFGDTFGSAGTDW